MSGTIVTATPVPGLLNEAINLAQELQKTSMQAKLAQSSTTFQNVSGQLDALSTSLKVISGEPRLQDNVIEQPMREIVGLQKELLDFLDRLETGRKPHMFRKSVPAGDTDDKTLNDILDRLGKVGGELHMCISTIRVGLTGNAKEGFLVSRDDLLRANEAVRQVLGFQLVLAKKLEPRWSTLKMDMATRQFRLETADVDALGLRDGWVDARSQQQQLSGVNSGPSANVLDWHNNKTADEPSILVGNSGYGQVELKTLTSVRADVRDSVFGKGLLFHVGHTKGGKDFFKRP